MKLYEVWFLAELDKAHRYCIEIWASSGSDAIDAAWAEMGLIWSGHRLHSAWEFEDCYELGESRPEDDYAL